MGETLAVWFMKSPFFPHWRATSVLLCAECPQVCRTFPWLCPLLSPWLPISALNYSLNYQNLMIIFEMWLFPLLSPLLFHFLSHPLPSFFPHVSPVHISKNFRIFSSNSTETFNMKGSGILGMATSIFFAFLKLLEFLVKLYKLLQEGLNRTSVSFVLLSNFL